MAELTELNSEAHRDLKVVEECVFDVAARQHVINIRANEIAHAVTAFPMFFTRDPGTGAFTVSIMTSFESGANLFVQAGGWDATFSPSAMTTYPLFLVKSESTEQGYAVGFDEQSPAFSKDDGRRLFEDSGQPSLYLDEMTKALQAGAESDIQTRYFIEKLEELELFKPIDVLVSYADGKVQKIQGLHTVDEERLQEFPDDRLLELQKSGYLLPLHAMLMSTFQLNALIRRQNQSSDRELVTGVKLQVARDGAD